MTSISQTQTKKMKQIMNKTETKEDKRSELYQVLA